MASNTLELAISTKEVESICRVTCLEVMCKHNLVAAGFLCGFKHLQIGYGGKCAQFEPKPKKQPQQEG